MAQCGCIYKGLKPVYWCPDCETALAEAEIDYMDKRSRSVYVKFLLKDDKGKFRKWVSTLKTLYVLIWTTTIWTPSRQCRHFGQPGFCLFDCQGRRREIYCCKRTAGRCDEGCANQ